MRTLIKAALAAGFILSGGPVAAEDKAGDFDYYVAVFTWNASFCALSDDPDGSEQCDPRLDLPFVTHGLWPQNEFGKWPEYCRTEARDPSRSESRAMSDIMGSGGLAWHQWKKHGRCSGLSAKEYFALIREVTAKVAVPDVLEGVDRDLKLNAEIVEAAFMDANPWMKDAGVSVSCRDGYVYEVRVCFSKGLTPRACTGNIARDCTRDVILPAIR